MAQYCLYTTISYEIFLINELLLTLLLVTLLLVVCMPNPYPYGNKVRSTKREGVRDRVCLIGLSVCQHVGLSAWLSDDFALRSSRGGRGGSRQLPQRCRLLQQPKRRPWPTRRALRRSRQSSRRARQRGRRRGPGAWTRQGRRWRRWCSVAGHAGGCGPGVGCGAGRHRTLAGATGAATTSGAGAAGDMVCLCYPTSQKASCKILTRCPYASETSSSHTLMASKQFMAQPAHATVQGPRLHCGNGRIAVGSALRSRLYTVQLDSAAVNTEAVNAEARLTCHAEASNKQV